MPHRTLPSIRRIGANAIDVVLRLGYAARFIGLTLAHSGTSFARPRLIIRELYYTGVLSLIIILVSGLFVGMVLGLQGYQTLTTYGSESALGVLVALSLVRELNDTLGTTSLVVTHDVQEALDVVDYVYYLSDGKMMAHGTPEEMRANKDPLVYQFVHGEAEGPVAYQYPSKDFSVDLNLGARRAASPPGGHRAA